MGVFAVFVWESSSSLPYMTQFTLRIEWEWDMCRVPLPIRDDWIHRERGIQDNKVSANMCVFACMGVQGEGREGKGWRVVFSAGGGSVVLRTPWLRNVLNFLKTFFVFILIYCYPFTLYSFRLAFYHVHLPELSISLLRLVLRPALFLFSHFPLVS
jgi:hypothetical protein